MIQCILSKAPQHCHKLNFKRNPPFPLGILFTHIIENQQLEKRKWEEFKLTKQFHGVAGTN